MVLIFRVPKTDHFQDMDVSTSDMWFICIPWWCSFAMHSYVRGRRGIAEIHMGFGMKKKDSNQQQLDQKDCCTIFWKKMLYGVVAILAREPAVSSTEHRDDQCILKKCRCVWRWKENRNYLNRENMGKWWLTSMNLENVANPQITPFFSSTDDPKDESFNQAGLARGCRTCHNDLGIVNRMVLKINLGKSY